MDKSIEKYYYHYPTSLATHVLIQQVSICAYQQMFKLMAERKKKLTRETFSQELRVNCGVKEKCSITYP